MLLGFFSSAGAHQAKLNAARFFPINFSSAGPHQAKINAARFFFHEKTVGNAGQHFHFKNSWFQTRKFKFEFIGSIIVLGVACVMWVVCALGAVPVLFP